MDFKQILNYILRDNNFTQTELAKKLNIKPSQISEWLRGKANPGYDTLKNISVTLGISADYLLGLEDDFGAKTYNVSCVDSPQLTPEERKLIEDYRKLNFYKQQLIKSNIQAMLPADGAEKSDDKRA